MRRHVIMKRITLSALLMTLFLLISCGSGQQPQAGKDGEAATGGRSLSEVLMEVGRSAENAFYSFLELLSDTLGFTVTKDTKKSEVGDYFSSLGVKLEAAANDLEQVAVKATADVEKDDASKNPIRVAVDAAKTTLNTLKTHLDSLKGVGDDKVVGWAENDQQGIKPADDGLNKLLNALQSIVKAATNAGVLAPKAGNTTLTVNGVDNKDGAKVLAIDKPEAAVGEKASLIVSAVTGEEILASIVASKEGDQALGAAADGTTTAMSFAKGGTKDNLNANTPKAAAVAGGIALRSLVKDGKLASHNDNSEKAVQAAGVTAANKLLVAVEDVIKKTVKNVLKTAKEKIDEARVTKPADQQ
ncbi:variable large family protein (plasmid) [Borrelia turicatae 91E135]|nr:variable large family protein [Borrelia turicatae]UPA14167.1 variable large family protein [Borrelia turicatae 91E135]